MDGPRAAARSSRLPSGTVTLLFTDIESSTKRWEERQEAMAIALRRHDHLLRTAIESHDGYVFKTVGDAFCAAFASPAAGVAAALAAQRALHAEDWSAIDGLTVRMALHTGVTHEREGDYFGPVVNRVARLLSTVHGGQVVLSAATECLLRGTVLPEGTSTSDLGEHRLRDLSEAEQVWQLCGPGLPHVFPPLRSLRVLPNNLPRQATPLVGREDVVSEVSTLTDAFRLLTLVGSGGVGKTRIALQVAADLLDGVADGAWLVELAPLGDGTLICGTIALALGVPQRGDRPALETLLGHCKSKRLLLVLDNCEHIVEDAARIAAELLDKCNALKIVATSREALRIPGERVYRVPSLNVPTAAALFVERAAASDGSFRLSDQNADAVDEICRRLDGIPLAIELAAARVRVLPPQQLARRLDQRFKVLSGGYRTALPRQQTMRALLDWSHDLLHAREQRLFRRLAVFSGGWSLAAATAVCTDNSEHPDQLEEWDVIDVLDSLADKSLVCAQIDEEQRRYELLESTRAYALEKLDESGEREEFARRHAEFVASRAEISRHFASLGERVAFWRSELGNVRSALSWSLSQNGDGLSLALRILRASQRFFAVTLPAEGLQFARRLLDRSSLLHGNQQAELWILFANLRGARSEELETIDRAIELLAGEATPALREAHSLRSKQLAIRNRFQEALEANRQARAVHDAIGAAESSARARTHWDAILRSDEATLLYAQGRLAEAQRAYADASELFTSIADDTSAATALVDAAEVYFAQGDPQTATALASQALEVFRRAGIPLNVALALNNIACYRFFAGALGEGAGALAEAIERAPKVEGKSWLVTAAIRHAALLSAMQERYEVAARLFGYVAAATAARGASEPAVRHECDEIARRLRSNRNEEESRALAAEGAALSENAALEIARGVIASSSPAARFSTE